MLQELAQSQLWHLVDRGVVLFALVLARTVPIVELAPFLGGRAAPRTVKIAVALALTTLVAPALWVAAPAPSELGPATFAALIVKEVLVGLTLGFVTALVFEAVRIAGQIIDAVRGQTMANVMVPQLPERVSVTADYLYLLAVALFFAFGGHLLFLEALARSYVVFPVTQFPALTASGLGGLALELTRLFAETIAFGALLAFPVVAAILLADLVLALLNRAAPQVNVFFLGMPLKAALGTAVVLLGLGVFTDTFAAAAVEGVDAVLHVTNAWRG